MLTCLLRVLLVDGLITLRSPSGGGAFTTSTYLFSAQYSSRWPGRLLLLLCLFIFWLGGTKIGWLVKGISPTFLSSLTQFACRGALRGLRNLPSLTSHKGKREHGLLHLMTALLLKKKKKKARDAGRPAKEKFPSFSIFPQLCHAKRCLV